MGKGEGIPINRANSMEGAPLPARASQGEGAACFRDGGGIQMRRSAWPKSQLTSLLHPVCLAPEDYLLSRLALLARLAILRLVLIFVTVPVFRYFILTLFRISSRQS